LGDKDVDGRDEPGHDDPKDFAMRFATKKRLLPNPHPGEVLVEEFLKPTELSQTAPARAIGVSPRRINEIVLGKRAITADTDLRLARYFSLSERPADRLRIDEVQAHESKLTWITHKMEKYRL
jgi:addiction module HigA family antidote